MGRPPGRWGPICLTLACLAGCRGSSGWFLSYDDPRSIGVKMEYAKALHLGGIMIWELGEGYVADPVTDPLFNPAGSNHPLLDVVRFGADPGMWVTAYYARFCPPSPAELDYAKVTHIIHENVDADRTKAGSYWDYPPPGRDWFEKGVGECGPEGVDLQADLIRLAHARDVNVLLGIAAGPHLRNGDDLPSIGADPAVLAQFVASLSAYARSKGYDGFDIDWEYPSGPAEERAFAEILAALRSELDAWTPPGVLTAAVSNSLSHAYPVEALARYADQINVMSYDLAGPWNRLSGFNTPMAKPADCPDYDGDTVRAGIESWLASAIPAAKLGLGVSFLSYRWDGIDSYCRPTKGSGGARTRYADISANRADTLSKSGTRHWQEEAQAPYLAGK